MDHAWNFFADHEIYVAIAFILFFVLLWRKIWAALSSILDARATAVRAELDEAERLRREAEAMLNEAQARRDAAIAESRRLVEGAKAEAQRIAQAAADDAQQAARRREQMAMDRIAAAEKAAVDDVRTIAADVATAAVRDVMRHGLPGDTGSRLIDHAIAGLPAALSSRRAA
jgi:F-type H+-transporting ATPase subunit b